MAIRAVLDAAVLYPFSLRDTLLRLAERELYDPVWSARILDEMRRNLVDDGRVTDAGAHRMVSLMRKTFEDAEVRVERIQTLEGAMQNHPGDRHVLAAAVAAGAGVVVTSNLRDFRDEACQPFGVEAQHPDEFLEVLLHKAPGIVVQELERQAASLAKPPWTFRELLHSLEVSVPSFVNQVRQMRDADA